MFKERVEAQYIIAGDAKYVANAIILQSLDQELGDRQSGNRPVMPARSAGDL
jgi:hypothetical protein